jgi:hypothetical protein
MSGGGSPFSFSTAPDRPAEDQGRDRFAAEAAKRVLDPLVEVLVQVHPPVTEAAVLRIRDQARRAEAQDATEMPAARLVSLGGVEEKGGMRGRREKRLDRTVQPRPARNRATSAGVPERPVKRGPKRMVASRRSASPTMLGWVHKRRARKESTQS